MTVTRICTTTRTRIRGPRPRGDDVLAPVENRAPALPDLGSTILYGRAMRPLRLHAFVLPFCRRDVGGGGGSAFVRPGRGGCCIPGRFVDSSSRAGDRDRDAGGGGA